MSKKINVPPFKVIKPSDVCMSEMFDYPISACLDDSSCWSFEGLPGKSKPSIAIRTILDLARITEIYFYQEGENDERAWIFLAKHKSGYYVYFCASCDYTGFDCQGGGEIIIDKSLSDLWRLGVPTSMRETIVESLGFKVCKCNH